MATFNRRFVDNREDWTFDLDGVSLILHLRQIGDYFWLPTDCCSAPTVPMIPSWSARGCGKCGGRESAEDGLPLRITREAFIEVIEGKLVRQGVEPLTAFLLADRFFSAYEKERDKIILAA